MQLIKTIKRDANLKGVPQLRKQYESLDNLNIDNIRAVRKFKDEDVVSHTVEIELDTLISMVTELRRLQSPESTETESTETKSTIEQLLQRQLDTQDAILEAVKAIKI